MEIDRKSPTLSIGGNPDEPGSLFCGQIARDADATGNAQPFPAQTKISVTYDLHLISMPKKPPMACRSARAIIAKQAERDA